MGQREFVCLLTNSEEYLKPYAVTLTKDYESAQDLFQDTMFRALANKDKYTVGTNLKAWLYTIMRNIFINNYRRQVRQQTVVESASGIILADQIRFAVYNDGEANLQLKELWLAVHRLPTIFKQPFMLYFDGYKYHEISYALNEPLGTIKSRIHFARKLLKEQFSRF
jgi:RNA polymerase sigma factor (sigma-70 family)